MKIRNVSIVPFAIVALLSFSTAGEAQQVKAAPHAVPQPRIFAPAAPNTIARSPGWESRQNIAPNALAGRPTERLDQRRGTNFQAVPNAQPQSWAQRPLPEERNLRGLNGGAQNWTSGNVGASAYAFHQPVARSAFPIFDHVDRVRPGFLGARVPEHRGFYDVVPYEPYQGRYLNELYGGIYGGRGRYNWGAQVILPFGALGVGFYRPGGPWQYCNGYRWWNPRTYGWVSVQINPGYGYDGVIVNPELFMYSQWYEDLETGTWYDAEGYTQPYAPELPPGARYGVLIPEDIQVGTADDGEPIVRHVKVMQTEVIPGDYAWGGPLTAYDTFSQVYINIPIRRHW